nr:S-adenosylmethionine sensor upstream of mTORC1 [Peromyscus maniculatus bairdii]
MPLKPAIGAAPFLEAALLAFAYAGTVSVVGFYELPWHFVNGGSQTKQLYKISEAENLLYSSYAQGKKKISLVFVLFYKLSYFHKISSHKNNVNLAHVFSLPTVGDFDKIWREHCEDAETLCEYAVAMKNLADNHWAKTCEGEGRIEWCCSICREYFQNGGKRKALEKDEKRAVLATKTTPALNVHESSKLEGRLTNLSFTSPEFITELLQASEKIRLLDVGSCFNPFLKFEEFLTVGIDIVPAVESVYKCDFLNLQLQQPLQLAQDAIDAFLKQLKNPIDSLPGELFHVVVFSLLLSYFPSPYQRWICCKKAHELLVLNGLLLIITPDSSHQNRHAMMMKSWKIAIESLGFKRFKYSKFSHMHLMAFRKTSLKTTSDLVSRNYPGMLYIPQDFNSVEDEEYSNPSCYVRSDVEDEQLAYGFTELPDAPYDSDSGESQASSIPFYELEDPILLLS